MTELDPIIAEDISKITASLGGAWEALAGKTILVTGANGFLPSYFVDTIVSLNQNLLAKNPATVEAVIRRPVQAGDRLAHCLGSAHVKFLHQDVGKDFQIPPGVDYIIHGASKATPKDYLANALDTMDANVSGARTLLEYGRRNPIKGLLFISSSEVYGDPDLGQTAIRETYSGNVDPIGPRSMYQESKRFGEALCYNFWSAYRVPAKIARCFLTYGPRMRLGDGRAIPDFMQSGLGGRDLEVKSGPASVRALSYVADTVEQLWRVLLFGKNGEAYNVGSDQTMTIAEVAALFVKLFENRIQAVFAEQRLSLGSVTSPKKVAPDLSKITHELGYANQPVSLENGLRRMKRWYELYGGSAKAL